MRKKPIPTLPIRSSEITSESVYLSRRDFIKSVVVAGLGAMFATACKPSRISTANLEPATSDLSSSPIPTFIVKETSTTASVDELTPYDNITNFNNFYEFTTSKSRVAEIAKDFVISPWQIEVSGLVQKPKIFDIEDLLKKFDQEERIYRLRCVETWSMVIPWLGFPLSKLLEKVEPLSSAKYVRFATLLDPQQMPGVSRPDFPWPYTEGLRLDEAMHDLTILATGLYGKPLLPQCGAPIRLVVPWKYGFKSIKSIIKIELTEKMPPTFWSTIAPREYGFYANVNPNVPHPRWSQSQERRIGEDVPRATLFLNGYADEVGYLYTNLDLKKNY